MGTVPSTPWFVQELQSLPFLPWWPQPSLKPWMLPSCRPPSRSFRGPPPPPRFSPGATGRSSHTEGADLSLSQTDMTGGLCFLLLTGGDEEKLSCVQRSACESPISAANYLQAAKMWYKMHKLIK